MDKVIQYINSLINSSSNITIFLNVWIDVIIIFSIFYISDRDLVDKSFNRLLFSS